MFKDLNETFSIPLKSAIFRLNSKLLVLYRSDHTGLFGNVGLKDGLESNKVHSLQFFLKEKF